MINKVFLTILLVMVHFASNAQCKIETKAFRPGERVTYSAFYNWGFIWINAGEVEFKVSSKKYEGRDVYHLYSYGASYKSYDWIFKIRQKYQAYVDPETLKPLWYERDVVEGSYTAFEEYKFDYNNNEIRTYIQKKTNPGRTSSLPLPNCIFDVLTSIYYFRSVDAHRLTVGEKIPITMVLDNKIYDLFIRYLGKEEVTTRNKKKL